MKAEGATVVLAAGGTGGHVVPALAVAEALKKIDSSINIVIFGTGRELEQKLVAEAGLRLICTQALPLRGAGIFAKLKLLALLPKTIFETAQALRRERASIVGGFGGYPSFTPVAASVFLRLPRFIQEQNVQVGIANRILSIFANKIFAVPGATGFFRKGDVLQTPNPVRAEFTRIKPLSLPRPGEKFRLLVLGGSQGARSINDVILELAEYFRELGIELAHQTGAADFDRVDKFYRDHGLSFARPFAFSHQMVGELEAAHVVVCRAGAMTVAEICASGRAAIYIPLEIAGAHQWKNVESLLREGGARVVSQNGDLRNALANEIATLVKMPEVLLQTGARARELAQVHGEPSAERIAREVVGLLQATPRRY